MKTITAIIIAAIYGLAVVACVAWWAGPAWPHDAPTGWAYDRMCCSGRDCAHVEAGIVTPTDEGWLIHIEPDDHPIAFRTIHEVVPYGDRRIRRSQDQDYHVCLSVTTNTLFCVYIPDFSG